MTWTFSVAACRYDGAVVRTTSYRLEGDAENARAFFEADTSGLAETATSTFRGLGRSDVIVEMGRVDAEPYVLVLRRGAVLALAREITPLPLDEHAWSEHAWSLDAPLMLGPSAALAVAEEWSLSTTSILSTVLSLGNADRSPYPPHRSPLGAAPLHAIATDPFRWSRPFAALDADRNAVLTLSSSRRVDASRNFTLIESLVPLVANGNAMEWLASISGGTAMRIRAPLPLLIGSITGATGEPAPALVDDPVAGERYGYAPPLATALTLRDVLESAS